MMNRSLQPDEIEPNMKALAAYEPDPHYDVLDPINRHLPGREVKFVFPPRMSRKMIHALRHAASKAFQQLGLKNCATIQVR